MLYHHCPKPFLLDHITSPQLVLQFSFSGFFHEGSLLNSSTYPQGYNLKVVWWCCLDFILWALQSVYSLQLFFAYNPFHSPFYSSTKFPSQNIQSHVSPALLLKDGTGAASTPLIGSLVSSATHVPLHGSFCGYFKGSTTNLSFSRRTKLICQTYVKMHIVKIKCQNCYWVNNAKVG